MIVAPSLRLGRLADLPALILFACLLFGLPGACGDAGAVATLAKQHAAVGSAAASGALPPSAQRQSSEAVDFNRRGEEKGADVDLDVGRDAAHPVAVVRVPALVLERQVRHAAIARTHHPRDPPAIA